MRRGLGVGLCHGPLGEDVPRAWPSAGPKTGSGVELLDGSTGGEVEGQRVDLDGVAGVLERDVLRLTDGVGPGFGAHPRATLRISSGTGVTRPRSTRLFRMRPTVALETIKRPFAAAGRACPCPEGKVEPEPLDLSAQGRRPSIAARPVWPPALHICLSAVSDNKNEYNHRN